MSKYILFDLEFNCGTGMAVICGWTFIQIVGKSQISHSKCLKKKKLCNILLARASFCLLFAPHFFFLFCLCDSTAQIQFPTSVPIISCHHTIVHKIITVNSTYITQQAYFYWASGCKSANEAQILDASSEYLQSLCVQNAKYKMPRILWMSR